MKHNVTLTFSQLITKYSALQSKVLNQLNKLQSSISGAQPAKFLLIQFGMSQLTQIGDSISNMISQVNSVINAAVRNQKTT